MTNVETDDGLSIKVQNQKKEREEEEEEGKKKEEENIIINLLEIPIFVFLSEVPQMYLFFHIRTVPLYIIKVLFIYQLMH